MQELLIRLCQIAGSARTHVALQPAPPHRADYTRRGPRGGRATLRSGNCRESARNPLGVTKWGPKPLPTGRASGSFPRGRPGMRSDVGLGRMLAI
jgi:hypothetical protein